MTKPSKPRRPRPEAVDPVEEVRTEPRAVAENRGPVMDAEAAAALATANEAAGFPAPPIAESALAAPSTDGGSQGGDGDAGGDDQTQDPETQTPPDGGSSEEG